MKPTFEYSFSVFSISAPGPRLPGELLVNVSQMCGERWSQDGKMTVSWNNNATSLDSLLPGADNTRC